MTTKFVFIEPEETVISAWVRAVSKTTLPRTTRQFGLALAWLSHSHGNPLQFHDGANIGPLGLQLFELSGCKKWDEFYDCVARLQKGGWVGAIYAPVPGEPCQRYLRRVTLTDPVRGGAVA